MTRTDFKLLTQTVSLSMPKIRTISKAAARPAKPVARKPR